MKGEIVKGEVEGSGRVRQDMLQECGLDPEAETIRHFTKPADFQLSHDSVPLNTQE